MRLGPGNPTAMLLCNVWVDACGDRGDRGGGTLTDEGALRPIRAEWCMYPVGGDGDLGGAVTLKDETAFPLGAASDPASVLGD